MRKPFWMTLAVALLMGIGTTSSAQDSSAGAQKPLVTVSFAGYDQMISGVKTVGELAGRPELAKGLEGTLIMFTQGKGLAGLDKARPWGLAVYAGDEGKFPIQAFLPVTDLKELMALVPNMETGKPYEPDANGVYELKGKGQTMFAAQKGQWAFVVDNRDALKSVPADPSALLGDLSKKYLVAVRASVKSIPADLREKFMSQAKMMMEIGLQRQPGESDEQFAIRTNVSKQTFDKFVTLSKELNEVTVGWGLDAKTGAMQLDFEVTAIEGTQTAKQFARAKDAKTNFAGFAIPGAALTAIGAGEMDDADVAQVKAILGNLRTSATKDLDANEELTKDQRQLAKQLLSDVLDVAEKTIDTKKSDGGAVLLLEAGSPTFVAGGALAGGEKLDKVVKQLVAEVGKEQPDIVTLIKLDADTHEGVKFHVATVPIPDEEAAAVLGKTVEIVLGIGEGSFYLGAGKNPVATIKQVIDNSKKDAGKMVPPVHISVAGTPIAKFIAQVAPAGEPAKAVAAMVAEILSKSGGKDHLTLTAKAIPNGVSWQLNLEEGILKAAMSFLPTAGGPGGPGPGAPKAKPAGGDSPF